MAKRNNGKQYLVGVDLGGTKILAGVFDINFTCLGRSKVKTRAERGAGEVIERVARCVRDALTECGVDLDKVQGIGVGAPGAVDMRAGRVIFAPNLRWKDVLLKQALEEALNVPVFLENDCKLSTLGVYEAELKSKPRHVVGLFLGTGIGAGLILDGVPYTGFGGTAGEVGHMVIDMDGPECGCGSRGCFEALASRTAIFRTIHKAVKGGQETLLASMLGDDLADLRSGDLRKAIRRGDDFVEGVVRRAARCTGIAVGNLMNLFNPEVVVLGGGLIDQLEQDMVPVIEKVARKHALAGTADNVEIRATRLGDDAGITGGAVLARQESK
jgi:glucokinase